MSGLITATVVGTGVNAYLANKNAKKQADAIREQNAANAALHTMTPEEKANYFSSGVTKVNDATLSSQGLLDRNLAARGMGGNAVAAPNANLQRTRVKSIADVWNELTRTAMNMRAGTPPVTAVPAVQSAGDLFFGNLANMGASNLAPLAGKQIADYFKPKPTPQLMA